MPHLGLGARVSFVRSDDDGYTWSPPVAVPGLVPREHPGNLVRLLSGAVWLSYGRREVPLGVRGALSRRGDGRFAPSVSYSLLHTSANGDCGYPSTVVLTDGTIVTAYYAVSRACGPAATIPDENGFGCRHRLRWAACAGAQGRVSVVL